MTNDMLFSAFCPATLPPKPKPCHPLDHGDPALVLDSRLPYVLGPMTKSPNVRHSFVSLVSLPCNTDNVFVCLCLSVCLDLSSDSANTLTLALTLKVACRLHPQIPTSLLRLLSPLYTPSLSPSPRPVPSPLSILRSPSSPRPALPSPRQPDPLTHA